MNPITIRRALVFTVALPQILSMVVLQTAVARSVSAQEADPAREPATGMLGAGDHTYRWVSGWGQLPGGEKLGNTHGCVVVDKAGNIYANTDTERAVVVFSPAGKFLRAWGKEFQGGLHGMTLVEEGGKEFLYLAHTGRHEVVKTTLDGEVLWQLGYPKEAGVYKDGSRFRPTSVAVAPNGDLYVADGYGMSWVHHFDKNRKYVRSFGGRGTNPGQMRTPHGIFLDTRGSVPRLIVADRENNRLQFFSLQGELLGMLVGVVRRPCNVQRLGDDLVVADLQGRVTILGRDNMLITHLGDNPDQKKWAKNGVPQSEWQDGYFISPHSACWDQAGNLYVMDWLSAGRVSKLARLRDPKRGK